MKFILEQMPKEWAGKFIMKANTSNMIKSKEVITHDDFVLWIQKKYDEEGKEFVAFFPIGIDMRQTMSVIFKKAAK